jgi:hypothetical protein
MAVVHVGKVVRIQAGRKCLNFESLKKHKANEKDK